MTLLRWRWRPAGAHVAVRVYAATAAAFDVEPTTWALCGTLMFRAAEWADVVALLGPRVDVVRDAEVAE